jgi:hypothetical protein
MADERWERVLAALDSADSRGLILAIRDAIEQLFGVARDRWNERGRGELYEESREYWLIALRKLEAIQRERDGIDPVSFSLDPLAHWVSLATHETGPDLSSSRKVARRAAEELVRLFRSSEPLTMPHYAATEVAVDALNSFLDPVVRTDYDLSAHEIFDGPIGLQ